MNIKEEAQEVLNNAEDVIHSLPDVAERVEGNVETWKRNATRFIQQRPGVSLLGAFVIGFALAKAARHV